MRLPLGDARVGFILWCSPRLAHEQDDRSHATRPAPKYKVDSSPSTSFQFVKKPLFLLNR